MSRMTDFQQDKRELIETLSKEKEEVEARLEVQISTDS